MRKPFLTIQESGQRAAAVVQDLLTLARRGATLAKPVNLNEIIREFLDMEQLGMAIRREPDREDRGSGSDHQFRRGQKQGGAAGIFEIDKNLMRNTIFPAWAGPESLPERSR